ncbi:MAG: histidine phosphatase family protein [archaeon]|jgi:broad specificity phosphatase PhoE
MKIYLIRHGETTGYVEDRYGGTYDDHLSEHGQEQVSKLAEKLAGKGIEIIYHSPLIRAKETANVVAKSLNISIEEKKDLQERNQYGVLSGLTKKDAKEKFLSEVEKLKKHSYKNYVTDSESYEEFVPRIITAFEEILKTEKATIAIITHGGPIKAIFREFLQLGEFKKLGDCAVIEIEKDEHSFAVLSLDNAELIFD